MARTIYLDNGVLIQDKKFTFLSQDVVAGATTVGVKSTIGFHSLTTSSGQIILIGELGQEKTEIIKTSSSSAPGGVSITTNALRFDHPSDTKVYIIDWDRFEIQHASTITGTKSTLQAYPEDLQSDQLQSLYRDTAKTSGYYFTRFNESIGDSDSDWSDPTPYGGYDANTVHAIKQRALNTLNQDIDNVVTNEFLDEALWQLRREYHQMPGKRPFRRRFNRNIGIALTGSYRIDLPSDVEKPHSAENVFGVRIGVERNMDYIDKKSWDFYYLDTPHSTLELPYTVDTSTSIWIANGRDFDQTGAISVEGTNISYEKASGSQNSLTITTHGDWSLSAGSDAWQNVSYGLPDMFTVWSDPGGSAFIYFNRPLETAYVNQNIFVDYYRKVVDADSDADALDEPDPDIFVPGLCWAIKKRRNPQLEDLKDSDFVRWQTMKEQAWRNEYASTEINLIPDVPPLFDAGND